MLTIKKLIGLLSAKEKKQAVFLLLMVLIMAILDLIGIASIMPFIAVLSNPSIIETNKFLFNLYNFSMKFGVGNISDFLFYLGVIVFFLLIFSLLFKSLTFYFQIRFSLMREYTIGKRLMRSYIYQPYSWFLNKNSSELGKNILSEVNTVITHGIQPMVHLFAQIIVAASIILFLLFLNIIVAVSSFAILGLSYAFIYLLIRQLVINIGKKRVKANEQRYLIVNESFGGIKEIKFSNLEDFYLKKFSKSAKIFSINHALGGVLWQIPRYFIEAIAFGGIILSILYFMSLGKDFNSILPIIVIYSVAGYRLMPALNLIYISLTKIRFVGPALDMIYEHLNLRNNYHKNEIKNHLSFDKSLNLQNIGYQYPNSDKASLKNINIILKTNSKIGIIGPTGSGKTTLVDIVLGLLEPQTGSIKVDDQIVDKKNIEDWQNLIGYVPQFIYLLDDTIMANIVFGHDNEKVDQKKLDKVARISNIDNFINELPNKFQTLVGERGVRLSGGQIQRIGIARALYREPKILILDEATSSLDIETETEVMREINNNIKESTIIAIAHRLSTLKDYDQIYLLENGTIKSSSSYQNLMTQIT